MEHEAQAGQVGGRPPVSPRERLEEGRAGEADGNSVPLDEEERPLRFDVIGHDDGATHEQHRQDVDPGTADAEERSEGDRHVVVAELGAREEVDDVPGHVGVRQHHALRQACRPGRVRQEQQILEVDRHVGVAGAPFGEQRFVVQRAGARTADGDPVED